ncbi:FkbM family methyltransferase [Marinobacter fonticola]|uniref:FkbM family methyltransferase n=1 Tax=Marinobacter fonticola TaxID=2603215 RepID=UPI0011E7D3E9|nr:FkbM family methyltransferase [Marinobacter fonticola]
MSALRTLLKKMYYRYYRPFKSSREKKHLRKQITDTTLSANCPFEIEAKLLRALDFRNSSMLDVGANVGFYSAALEDVFGAEHVYLFEPLPSLNKALRDRFPKSRVFDLALSNMTGRQKIRVPIIKGTLYDTRATLNDHQETGQTGAKEVEISLKPLDEVVDRELDGPVGLIKIDVEGHELQVIEGAIRTITEYHPLLLVEIEARHHKYPIEDIFRKIESLGYAGYFVSIGEYGLKRVALFHNRDQNPEAFEAREFSKYLNNFFFVAHEKEAEFVRSVRSTLATEKARFLEAA